VAGFGQADRSFGRRLATQTGHLVSKIERRVAVIREGSRGRGTSAASRCMNSSGDITRWVVPSYQAVLSLSTR